MATRPLPEEEIAARLAYKTATRLHQAPPDIARVLALDRVLGCVATFLRSHNSLNRDTVLSDVGYAYGGGR